MIRWLLTFLATLCHVWFVQYDSNKDSSNDDNKLTRCVFPEQMGCSPAATDEFSIHVTQQEYPSGVSLAEFHAAFLCSPLARLYLWMLAKIYKLVPPAHLEPRHLGDIAMGETSCLGPWTAWALQGSRTRPVPFAQQSTTTTTTTTTTTSNSKPPCQIMRRRVPNQPSCDYWWAVEPSQKDSQVTLVFGMASTSTPAKKLSWGSRVYVRLLLASAKATLLRNRQAHSHVQ